MPGTNGSLTFSGSGTLAACGYGDAMLFITVSVCAFAMGALFAVALLSGRK